MVDALIVPPPMNLPFLINDSRERARAAVAKVFENDLDTAHQIDTLSPYYKIKAWFIKPLYFKVTRHWVIVKEDTAQAVFVKGQKDGTLQRVCKNYVTGVNTDCHIFNRIVWYNDSLLYTVGKRAKSGYFFPLEHMVKWEPIPYSKWMIK